MGRPLALEPRHIQLSARSWLMHCPSWWPTPDATMQQLLRELPLRQEHIRMYGKMLPQPRLTAVAGRSMDPASRYRRPNPDMPWTPTARAVRENVAQAVRAVADGWQPTGLIANYYRSGATDSIGWHADDEPALGVDPIVVSVSFGATRRMRFKRPGPGPTLITVDLSAGDLLVMGGATQSEFQHAINRQADAGPRLSLTFRQYAPHPGDDSPTGLLL